MKLQAPLLTLYKYMHDPRDLNVMQSDAPTAEDRFQSIPGLIRRAGVYERNGLLSHVQNECNQACMTVKTL